MKEAVDLWAYGRALGQVAPRVPSGTGMPQHQQGPVPRDLLLLLSTLHQLVSYIPGPDAVLDSAALPQPLSVSACPSSEVGGGSCPVCTHCSGCDFSVLSVCPPSFR